ncbi:unnamed protein product [Candida parapsilosis]
MTKATETGLTLFFYSQFILLYTGVIPSPVKFHDEILPFLPWLGIVTFKDKKDKYEELKLQIEEAKAFYKSKGIDID